MEKELLEAEQKIREFVFNHPKKEEIGNTYTVYNRVLFLDLSKLFYDWADIFLKAIVKDVTNYETPIKVKGEIGGQRSYSYSDVTYYINKTGTKIGSNYGEEKIVDIIYDLFSTNNISIEELKFQIIELKKLIEKIDLSIVNLTKLSPAFALDSL